MNIILGGLIFKLFFGYMKCQTTIDIWIGANLRFKIMTPRERVPHLLIPQFFLF